MEDEDGEKTEPLMGAVLARNQWASNSQDRMGYVRRRLGRAFWAGVVTPEEMEEGSHMASPGELAPRRHMG